MAHLWKEGGGKEGKKKGKASSSHVVSEIVGRRVW